MKKKTVRTIENEYNDDGNLVKSVETITEEVVHAGIKPQNHPLESHRGYTWIHINEGVGAPSPMYDKMPPPPPEGPPVRSGL